MSDACCRRGNSGNIGPRGPTGPTGVSGATGVTGATGVGVTNTIIPFSAAESSYPNALTIYLGYGAFSTDVNQANFVLPRAGTITDLVANVAENTLTQSTTISLVRSPICLAAFSATNFSIVVTAGATGCFQDSDTLGFSTGNRIALEVAIGSNGTFRMGASMECI